MKKISVAAIVLMAVLWGCGKKLIDPIDPPQQHLQATLRVEKQAVTLGQKQVLHLGTEKPATQPVYNIQVIVNGKEQLNVNTTDSVYNLATTAAMVGDAVVTVSADGATTGKWKVSKTFSTVKPLLGMANINDSEAEVLEAMGRYFQLKATADFPSPKFYSSDSRLAYFTLAGDGGRCAYEFVDGKLKCTHLVYDGQGDVTAVYSRLVKEAREALKTDGRESSIYVSGMTAADARLELAKGAAGKIQQMAKEGLFAYEQVWQSGGLRCKVGIDRMPGTVAPVAYMCLFSQL